MAYFSNSSQQSLIATNTSTVTFGTHTTSNVVTVGFYPITSAGIYANTPSMTLCSGVNYVLRIYVANSVNGFLGQSTAGNYSVIAASPTFSTNGMSIFTINATTPIYLATPFAGTLSSVSDQYTLIASTNFANVGYTTSLPSSFNMCQNCSCANGNTCNNDGTCTESTHTCKGITVCSGICPGTCANGGTCVANGNIYTCTAPAVNWWWIIGIIVLIFIILLIGILVWFASSNSSNSTTTIITSERDRAIPYK